MFLANNKAGAPIEAIETLSKALMLCQYYPTTTYGVSPKYNRNYHQDPFWGRTRVFGQALCSSTRVRQNYKSIRQSLPSSPIHGQQENGRTEVVTGGFH